MSKSKYNRIATIPISSIPKSKIGQAITEWAEGSEALEQLLWTCYNNGVETIGCHVAADSEDVDSYIQVRLNDSHEQIQKMLVGTQNMGNMDVSFSPDGFQPSKDYNPDWYKPFLTFANSHSGTSLQEDIFSKLKDSLEAAKKAESDANILEFLTFLSAKKVGYLSKSAACPASIRLKFWI